MSFLSHTSTMNGIVDLFMSSPDRYRPFAELLAQVMSGPSELSAVQKETIALHVSTLNNCQYCMGSHGAVLKAHGIAAGAIDKIQQGHVEDPKMQPVLDFSKKLSLNPGDVHEADIFALKTAGWSDKTVEDIIAITSLFAFLNRLLDGIGMKGDEQGFEQGGAMLAQHGYAPMVDMLRNA